jgi:choline/glycine/proline betaine transport protein
VHFPSRDEVYRFMDSTVRPAIEEVSAVFVEKGLKVVTQPDPANDNVSLEIGHGDEHPFIYQVQMRGYFTPSLPGAAWVPRSSTTAVITGPKCT